jgi:type IX secretion system substrate protein/SprB-like repeat protein
MKIKILLLLLSCFSLLYTTAQSQSKQTKKSILSKIKNTNRSSGDFTYNLSVFSDPYVELTGGTSVNNDDLWDDPTYVVPIGFTFQLNDNAITSLTFNGVGALYLGNTTNPDILTLLFPFEVDILDRGFVSGTSESPISYVVVGSPGSRIFKLEIKNAGSYYEFEAFGTTDMYFSHQLWLYEGTNLIEFRYGDRLIEDPELFYAEGGAFVGLTDVDVTVDEYVNPHFLGGPASAPVLSVFDVTIEGTPAEETVYQLSLTLGLEVIVTGENSTSYCEPNGSATAEASGGIAPYAYEWSNGETTQTINNLDAGTYQVTVTDDLGNQGFGSVTITNVSPINPNAGATDETGVDANDGTAFSSAFGGSPPYDFDWSNGESTQTITGLSPGAYTITVTDSEGCTASQTVIVNPYECTGLEIEVLEFDANCNGLCDGLLDLTDVHNATPPFIYAWSNGLASEDASDLCAGEYFITVTDANGCVVSAGPYIIEEPAVLLANAGASSETSTDANDGAAWAEPTGGTQPYTYLWNNGNTESIITNLSPGIYTVTVTDDNGCTVSQQVIVDEFLCSGIIDPIHTDMSCYFLCDGEAGVLVTGGIGPFTYLWNTGDTDNFISDLCEGTYSVVITDVGANCTGIEVFDIFAPDTNVVTIDNILHYNNLTTGAINITASGGTPPYAYVWEGPNGYTSNAEDISGLLPGSYTVMVIDVNGCAISSDPIVILDETVSTNHTANLHARVYPNPANEQVIIDIENVSDFQIQLISLDGRTVKSWDGARVLEVDEISSGIYLLEGVSEAGVFRQQIAIQK